MADSEDVATRAPESDAAEDNDKKDNDTDKSPIPGDTKVDQGSTSLGVSGATLFDGDKGASTDTPRHRNTALLIDLPQVDLFRQELIDYNGTEVYISKPSDYPHSPSKLLLLLTGGTGIHSTNNQLQADQFAENGYLVVMPDQFAGDPVAKSTTTTAATTSLTPVESDPSIIEQIKLGIVSAAKSFTIDMWLARHTPEKVLPILDRVITSLKEDYADAVANGGGIYAAGYCFGAKYVCLLASSLGQDAVQGQRNPASEAEQGMVKQGPQIKCGVIAHGTVITRQDLEGVQVPLSIAAVKDDPLFPDDIRKAGVQSIRDKGGEVEEKVYDGVPHGFAVFGDYEDESIKEQQKLAFDQMLHFLQSH